MFDDCPHCKADLDNGRCLCVPIDVECSVCVNVGEIHCPECLGDGCHQCLNGYVLCPLCKGYSVIRKAEEETELSEAEQELLSLIESCDCD